MSNYTNPCVPHGFDDCCNVPEPVLDFSDCIDGGEHSGPVEYRMPLSGTGKSFPRCESHWFARLDRQQGINERYPDSPMAPSDFDPTYAGESWDGDY